jgi:hypothetical protein
MVPDRRQHNGRQDWAAEPANTKKQPNVTAGLLVSHSGVVVRELSRTPWRRFNLNSEVEDVLRA